MTTATLPAPAATLTDTPCDEACIDATGHICRCACGGINHGRAHAGGRLAARLHIQQRIARTGDVFLGAAADADEEW